MTKRMMLSTLFRAMSDLYHSFLQVTFYATTLKCCLSDPLINLHQGLLLRRKNTPVLTVQLNAHSYRKANKKSTAQLYAAQPGPSLCDPHNEALSTGVSHPWCPSRAPQTFVPHTHAPEHPSARQMVPSLPRRQNLVSCPQPSQELPPQVKQNWLLIRKLFTQQAEEKCSSNSATNIFITLKNQ